MVFMDCSDGLISLQNAIRIDAAAIKPGRWRVGKLIGDLPPLGRCGLVRAGNAGRENRADDFDGCAY
jgi:hypothetical protein